jgi:GTPase SAR1 family protein
MVSLLREKNLLRHSLDYRLLSVTLYDAPEAEVKRDWKQEIAVSEQLFGTLANFKAPVVVEIAVPNVGEEIHFYFAADVKEIDALFQQVQSFWPGAEIEKCDDYNIFHPQGGSVVSCLKQDKDQVLPLKTYDKLEEDALLPILNVFSSLAKEGEGVSLQAVFKKTHASTLKSFKKILEELQKGGSLKEAIQKAGGGSVARELGKSFGAALKTMTEQKTEGQDKPEKKESDADLVELVNRKISRPLFDVNVRLVVSALTEARAEMIMTQIGATLPQFFEPRGNTLELKKLTGKKEAHGFYDFSFRYFRPNQAMLLNSQELAGLIHVPTKTILGMPKIRKRKARTAPPPLNLPQEGIELGQSLFRGDKKIVRLMEADRFRHLYVIGQTGTGKSTFLKSLARQDVLNGQGLAILDPHGDFAEDLLGYIPENRWDDVVYFNPADTKHPIAFNMLEYDRNVPEQRTSIVNELLEIIGKIYNLAETGGPIFEQYFKNALLLLLNDPVINPTIMDMPRVFADPGFRRQLLERSPDPLVVSFWEKEAEKTGGDMSLANVTPYVTSKLNPFIANDYIKPIVCQERSSFDLKEIINNRKIFIANLSKGLLGETNAFFLGMMLAGKIFMHALGRASLSESERLPFHLYIDEFQNITTKTITQIFSEARKYRLSLNVAHQYIDQLKEGGVKEAVFGNVGSIVAFRVGPDDANYLKQQFAPVFNEFDLLNIDNLNAYIRMQIQGKTVEPFNLFVPFPPRPQTEIKEKVIELSRAKYCRPRDAVIAEIHGKYQNLI